MHLLQLHHTYMKQSNIFYRLQKILSRSWAGITFNPFALKDFAEKCVLKLVEWFSGHCHAIKS